MKRLISLFLVMLMFFTSFDVAALAAPIGWDETVTQSLEEKESETGKEKRREEYISN